MILSVIHIWTLSAIFSLSLLQCILGFPCRRYITKWPKANLEGSMIVTYHLKDLFASCVYSIQPTVLLYIGCQVSTLCSFCCVTFS